MAFEPRDNSGVLFRNEDKTEDKHPSGKGSALINGVEYWVSSWTKEGKNGRYQSLAFKRKDEAKANHEASKRMKQQTDDDADLPF